jgi:hypothetical protein
MVAKLQAAAGVLGGAIMFSLVMLAMLYGWLVFYLPSLATR